MPETERDRRARETLSELRTGRIGAVATSRSVADNATPQELSEVNAIAETLGLAPVVVRRNLDVMRQRAAAREPDPARVVQETPTLTDWLVKVALRQARPTLSLAVKGADMVGLDAAGVLTPALGFFDWYFQAPRRAKAAGDAQVKAGMLAAQILPGGGGLTPELELEMEQAIRDMQFRDPETQWWMVNRVDDVRLGFSRMAPTMVGAAFSAAERAGTLGVGVGVAAGTAAALTGPAAPFTAAGGLVAGVTAGGVLGAAEFAYRLEAGLAYLEFRDMADENGNLIDPDVAMGAAMMVGGANSGLEVLGLGILLKPFGLGTRLASREVARKTLQSPTMRAAIAGAMRTFTSTLAKETAVEVAQEGVTISGATAGAFLSDVRRRDDTGDSQIVRATTAENFERLYQTAIESMASMAPAVLPGSVNVLVRNVQQLQRREALELARAEETEQFFETAAQAVTAQPSLTHMPEAATSGLEHLGTDETGTSYIGFDAFTEYWEERGADPVQMATQLTGDPDAYTKAQADKEHLAVPTANYLVQLANTEHEAFFRRELTLDPKVRNIREIEEELERVEAEEAALDTSSETFLEVQALVEQKAAAAGVPAEQLPDVGRMTAQAITLAQRAGVDPVAFARETLGEDFTIARQEVLPSGGLAPAAGETLGQGPRQDLEVREEVTGAHSGQVNFQLEARTPDGTLVGLLEASEFQGVPHVNMLTVAPAARRTGVATRLMQELQESFPGVEIETGMTTEEGTAFLASAPLGTPGGATFSQAAVAPAPALTPENSPYAGQWTPDWVEDVTADAFLEARNRTSRPGLLTDLTAADLEGATIFLSGDGQVGGVLMPDGDMGNLFNNGPVKGAATEVLLAAIEAGGRTADAFDFYLPDLYANFGLQETGRMRFVDEFAPDGWDFDVAGRPDVVFLALIGEAGTSADIRARLAQARDAGTRDGWLPAEPTDNVIDDFDAGKREALVAADARRGEVSGGVSPADQGPGGRQRDIAPGAAAGRPVAATVFFQPGRGDSRGSIEFGDPRGVGKPETAVQINLLETADASTFFHELGHFYLKVITDLVAGLPEGTLTDSQQLLKDDLALILEDLGATDAASLTNEQQEVWARKFERYLAEGVAPTKELKNAFARFRDWLTQVYSNLSQLDVTLTDDVRGVMDRLVVTDQALERAGAEVLPLFTTAESAGMTAELFTDYQERLADVRLRAKEALQSRLLRERKAAQGAARAETQAEVEREVHAQRGYRTLAAITIGTQPDRSPLEANGAVLERPLFLDKAKVLEVLAPRRDADRVLEALRRRRVYRIKDGQDPGQVAEMFGYGTASEMLDELYRLPPMSEVIANETNRRMAQQFGGTLVEGRLPDAADAAVYGKRRAAIVQAELRALTAEMEGDFVPSAETLETDAQKHIDGLPINKLRPGLFLQAVKRNARRAFDLMASGEDRLGAIDAKVAELVALTRFRLATQAREQSDKTTRWVKRHNKPSARARTGRAGSGYLDQWDRLVERFAFGPVDQDIGTRTASLQAWAAQRNIEGDGEVRHEPVEIPPEVLDESWRLNDPRNPKAMTVGEFTLATDTMRQIIHLARADGKFQTEALALAVAEAQDLAIATIETNGPKARLDEIESGLPRQWFPETLASLNAWNRKLASMVYTMDGQQVLGPIGRMTMQILTAASEREQVLKEASTRFLHEAFEVFDTADVAEMSRETPVPGLGRAMSRGARIMVALNYGNKEGRQQVLDSNGWSPEQAQLVIDSLDAKDWSWINAVVTEVNRYWAESEAKQKRVVGVAPRKVPALSIPTRSHGVQPGGYFRIKADPTLSSRALEQQTKEAAKELWRGAATRSTTRRGHLIERLEMKERKDKLWLNQAVIFNHLNEVIHDITHHEALLDVNRILGSRRVKAAIQRHYGQAWNTNIAKTLEDIAAGTIPIESAGAKAASYFVRGTSVARMGLNMMTAAVQPLGVLVAVPKLGFRHLYDGYALWLRSPEDFETTVAQVHAENVTMRFRHQNHMRETAEIAAQINPRGSWAAAAVGQKIGGRLGAGVGLRVANHYRVVEESYFYFIGKMQMMADMPLYLGAREKALEEIDPTTGELHTYERAKAVAAQFVVDTQGSGLIKDLAQSQRSSPLLKIFTQFYNFMNVVYNQVAETREARRRLSNPISRGRFFVDVLWQLSLVPMSEFALRELLRGEDDENESVLARAVRAHLAFIFGLFPGAREFSGAFEGFRYSGPAGAGFADELSSFIATATAEAPKLAALDFDEVEWTRLLREANQVGGIALHYPATQVERLVRSVMLAAEDPGEAFSSLFGGRPD